MHHRATVTLGEANGRPYHIQCTCATGGDFGGKQEAMEWMTQMHFRTLSGIDTAELQDLTPPEPLIEPATVAEEPAPAEPETVPAPAEPTPAIETPTVPEGEEPKEENLGNA